jgi:TrpR-related protein YerC/YecD
MIRKERTDCEMLYKAILSLDNAEECAAFLEDICTIQEIEAMAQRLEVARRLSLGESYADINVSTGASTATIGRVSKALNYGTGGYEGVISKVYGENEK